MTAPANPVYRAESPNPVRIIAHQLSMGHLVFVALDVATMYPAAPPTESEARSVCPFGWTLYSVGDHWCARPMFEAKP